MTTHHNLHITPHVYHSITHIPLHTNSYTENFIAGKTAVWRPSTHFSTPIPPVITPTQGCFYTHTQINYRFYFKMEGKSYAYVLIMEAKHCMVIAPPWSWQEALKHDVPNPSLTFKVKSSYFVKSTFTECDYRSLPITLISSPYLSTFHSLKNSIPLKEVHHSQSNVRTRGAL